MFMFFFSIPSWILWGALLLLVCALSVLGKALSALFGILAGIAAIAGLGWLIQALRGKEESAKLLLAVCLLALSPWLVLGLLGMIQSLVGAIGNGIGYIGDFFGNLAARMR